jgi:hypothetical protein
MPPPLFPFCHDAFLSVNNGVTGGVAAFPFCLLVPSPPSSLDAAFVTLSADTEGVRDGKSPLSIVLSSFCSSALRIGLVWNPLMPLSAAMALSSDSALAVSAMMGTEQGRARMCRVAS